MHLNAKLRMCSMCEELFTKQGLKSKAGDSEVQQRKIWESDVESS
jgi:hypothetical protein